MKTILVILDGLNYGTAIQTMGHLQAYCRRGLGRLYQVQSELPALSRPLYECLLTGVAPIDSGVVNNRVTRLSYNQSIFHYARAAGLTTAAAAYYWISELYNRTPFNPMLIAMYTNRTCRFSTLIFITQIIILIHICLPTGTVCGITTNRILFCSIR